MNAEQRRYGILSYLKEAEGAVSATLLAKQFSVSRQIIVGDVAILRAGGVDVSATPRGYILQGPMKKNSVTRKIVCFHLGSQMDFVSRAVIGRNGQNRVENFAGTTYAVHPVKRKEVD